MTTQCPSEVEQVSYSKLACFLDCRRQFWFRYVEKIVPLRWPDAMTEGSLVHELLEHTTLLGLQGAVAKASEKKPDPVMLVRAEEAVTAVINSAGWQLAKVEENEIPFEMPVKIGSKTVCVRGKVDGRGTYSGTPVAFEFKRVSNISVKTLENIQVNNQSLFYRAALDKLGKPVEAVVYVFVSVPKFMPKPAVPKDQLRIKQNGEPYAGQQLVDETLPEYRARVKEWYSEHQTAVQIYVDQRSKGALKEFSKWLDSVIKDMRRVIKEKRFYLNSNACRMRSCSYRAVCLTDCPEVRQMCYTQSLGHQVTIEPTEAEEVEF